MSLGRISVKNIFLLTCGGMAVSMLAICAVLLWMTGESWVLIGGGLLMLCALAWLYFLTVVFSKRLSVFTRELCRAMDQMISGSGEPVRAGDRKHSLPASATVFHSYMGSCRRTGGRWMRNGRSCRCWCRMFPIR